MTRVVWHPQLRLVAHLLARTTPVNLHRRGPKAGELPNSQRSPSSNLTPRVSVSLQRERERALSADEANTSSRVATHRQTPMTALPADRSVPSAHSSVFNLSNGLQSRRASPNVPRKTGRPHARSVGSQSNVSHISVESRVVDPRSARTSITHLSEGFVEEIQAARKDTEVGRPFRQSSKATSDGEDDSTEQRVKTWPAVIRKSVSSPRSAQMLTP